MKHLGKYNLLTVICAYSGERRIYTASYSDGNGCIVKQFVDDRLPKTIKGFMANPDTEVRYLGGNSGYFYYKKR